MDDLNLPSAAICYFLSGLFLHPISLVLGVYLSDLTTWTMIYPIKRGDFVERVGKLVCQLWRLLLLLCVTLRRAQVMSCGATLSLACCGAVDVKVRLYVNIV